MSTIREAIADYCQNFHLGEKEQLELLLASGTTEQIIVTLADMLRTGSNENIGDAGLAIRDLITMTSKHDFGSEFRSAFQGSALIPVLEKMVVSGNFHTRQIAIYTLGKTGCQQSLPALRQAVPVLALQDPLALPTLIFEIDWLEPEPTTSLWTELLASPDYLVRWATLYTIAVHPPETRLAACAQLCQDPHPWVGAEANYLYQQTRWELDMEDLSKAERKSEHKKREVAGQFKAPALSFEQLKQDFHKYMAEHNMPDYRREQLDNFIQAHLLSLAETRASPPQRPQT